MARRLTTIFWLLPTLVACGDSSLAPIDAAERSDTQLDAGRLADADIPPVADTGADDATADCQRSTLEALLAELRADPEAAMLAQSRRAGWPAAVDGGLLVVTLDTTLKLVAGDHDDWKGTALNQDAAFAWLVIDVGPGSRYKFTDLDRWVADPWSRAYHYDNAGLMSQVIPADAHLERHFAVGDAKLAERVVRVWVPTMPATHVLYVHDGQNLFDPQAAWGGWKLQANARDTLMFVGIDNSAARMDEYTHVTDDIGGVAGGAADDYAAFMQSIVRPLVAKHYHEPAKVGTMGSSLGGLVSLYIADRHPGEYIFAASLSGTLGWGSMGAGITNETIIERYAHAGKRGTAIYIDSGGSGTTCDDGDGDGINDDDPSSSDNYCVNLQMETTLVSLGYRHDSEMWYWWEPDAEHNEAAWAARVKRPIDAFMGL